MSPKTTDHEQTASRRPLWQKLAWLVVIWSASVLTLSLVAVGLRFLMSLAGIQSPD